MLNIESITMSLFTIAYLVNLFFELDFFEWLNAI